jgi:anti-sigma factor RsiW
MSDLCNSDAAYVLGALSPGDRRAFEDHLRGCAECQVSVQRLAGLPGLLALTSAEAVEGDGQPIPDTLLPGLITRVQAERRRRNWVVGGALAAAVAAVLVLVGAMVVRSPDNTAGVSQPEATVSTSPSGTPPSSVTSSGAVIDETTVMKPVGSPGPMSASLQLADKKWGTAITVVCQYDQQSDASWVYDLAVIDIDGNLSPAGTWSAVPGVTARVATATSIPRDRIAVFEVRLPNGQAILRGWP